MNLEGQKEENTLQDIPDSRDALLKLFRMLDSDSDSDVEKGKGILDATTDRDLMYMANHGFYKKYKQGREIQQIDILDDFKHYKTEIKEKINELYSNIESIIIDGNNETIKFNTHFYLFVKEFIEYTKREHYKQSIQDELSGYGNGKMNQNHIISYTDSSSSSSSCITIDSDIKLYKINQQIGDKRGHTLNRYMASAKKNVILPQFK